MTAENKIEFYSFGSEDTAAKTKRPLEQSDTTGKVPTHNPNDNAPQPSQPSASQAGTVLPPRPPIRTGPPLFSDGVTTHHPSPAPNLILDPDQPKAKLWLAKLGLEAFPDGYLLVGVKRQKDETKTDGISTKCFFCSGLPST